MTKRKKILNVSWSRVREWMVCHWRYNLSYEQWLRPIRVAEPLWYGGVFHTMMEFIYEEQMKKAHNPYKRRERKALVAKLKREGMEGDDLETMLDYVTRYVDHTERQKSQEMSEVLLIEFPFSVPMHMDVFEGMGFHNLPYDEINYIGIMDLVGIRRSRVENWDHKLQANHPSTNSLDHPSISYPQMGLYSWASMFLGHFIQRSVLNVFGKRRASNNVQRYPLMVTETEALMWGEWLYEKVGEMLTNPDRSKSLGLFDCGNCHARYPCTKHQVQGGKGLKKALDATFEKSEYSPSKRLVWKKKFPAAALAEMRRQKK